ncbi:hypothetical protein [Streptomyces sp. NPDC059378]|uniref:hypothetical protein n=1 Tax=Streptomyces sp. NPDC059378 TaxID=3346815 RepID=UPI0036A3F350
MRPSIIAVAVAAALALTAGGYAVGATRQGGASERCGRTAHEFTTLAGQIRKQLRADADFDSAQHTVDVTRAEVLGVLVAQNPGCFDARTRATAAVFRQHASEGRSDAALCELTGIGRNDCSVGLDDAP